MTIGWLAAALLAQAVVTYPLHAQREAPQLPSLPTVFVFSPMQLEPAVVRAVPPVMPSKARAKVKRIPVSVTMYCLSGTTRTGRPVREGILAADPRVFPLGRHLEVFVGRRLLGRFLVDDTGGAVLGRTVDVWTPSCREATAFGRRRGSAAFVKNRVR
jgi:3D (Asp-Asp-Asp) domain-containing protein